jgi:4-hydroxy-tetrahydrodipicolinate reductase
MTPPADARGAVLVSTLSIAASTMRRVRGICAQILPHTRIIRRPKWGLLAVVALLRPARISGPLDRLPLEHTIAKRRARRCGRPLVAAGMVRHQAREYNPQVMPNIRVMHFGLGPIGMAIVKQVAARPGFKIVGAIDIDPAKVGRDLGDVVGLSKRIGVKISGDAVKALKAAKPDVVVLCTSSSIMTVMPQIETILKSKTAIVSTTEELSYPGYTHIRQARQIHAMAKKAKVGVLGTGVNPGFAMDALPIALTAVCERVDRVVVNRVQDARIRRLPFQQKIGAGLTTEQFQRKVEDGSVRHVGLTESIAMIADALGWALDRITDDIQPKIAGVTISSEHLAVDPGYVCGIIQDGVGYRKKEPVVKLHMEAYLGSPETYDSVDIEGSPSLSMKIAGGIHGDVATASIVVNSIPHVLNARPGLHTMRDLALPSFFSGR